MTRPCPPAARPSSWPGRSTTRTAWRWPWPTAPSPTRCATTCPSCKDTVGELRELCDRYGFAYYREWGLILDGWSRTGLSGVELARRGIGNLRSQGAFARMPYWLSLLADLSARNDQPGEARATLDAAIAAAQARDDVWWLAEVMRMRAAYDDEEAAISRLRSAAQMASAHGSTGAAPALRA